jgi:hypothetical protein
VRCVDLGLVCVNVVVHARVVGLLATWPQRDHAHGFAKLFTSGVYRRLCRSHRYTVSFVRTACARAFNVGTLDR